MPEELDREAADAKQDGYDFDRAATIETWKGEGWPGPLTPGNSVAWRVGRLWWHFDDLRTAMEIARVELTPERMEGFVIRCGMVYGHMRKQAEKERKRGR